MKNAIILHGISDKEEYYDPEAPSLSNAHWLPWLQAQLLKKDIAAATPEVPYAFAPDWNTWVKEVERFELKEDTLLIGHSTGAGFFIKYLSIYPHIKVGKVILVAPFLDPYQELTKNFFDDFEIDSELINRTDGVTVFYSIDDEDGVVETVRILKEKVPGILYKEFNNKGHFTFNDLKSDTFPEVLEALTDQ